MNNGFNKKNDNIAKIPEAKKMYNFTESFSNNTSTSVTFYPSIQHALRAVQNTE